MGDKTNFLFLYRHCGKLGYRIIESENMDDAVESLFREVGGTAEDTWIVYGFASKERPEELDL